MSKMHKRRKNKRKDLLKKERNTRYILYIYKEYIFNIFWDMDKIKKTTTGYRDPTKITFFFFFFSKKGAKRIYFSILNALNGIILKGIYLGFRLARAELRAYDLW